MHMYVYMTSAREYACPCESCMQNSPYVHRISGCAGRGVHILRCRRRGGGCDANRAYGVRDELNHDIGTRCLVEVIGHLAEVSAEQSGEEDGVGS